MGSWDTSRKVMFSRRPSEVVIFFVVSFLFLKIICNIYRSCEKNILNKSKSLNFFIHGQADYIKIRPQLTFIIVILEKKRNEKLIFILLFPVSVLRKNQNTSDLNTQQWVELIKYNWPDSTYNISRKLLHSFLLFKFIARGYLFSSAQLFCLCFAIPKQLAEVGVGRHFFRQKETNN